MGSRDLEVHPQYTDRKDTTSRDISVGGSGKNFHQRVEEFSMWKDEATFQDMEYKRRRDLKKKMKGAIRSDHRLIWSHRLYIPVLAVILISTAALLLSSIEGLGKGTIIWNEKHIFQIIGGIFLTIGIIGLMAVAAYTYHREDQVRAKSGYPSLFMSSLTGDTSTKNMEEFAMLHDTFVDRPRGCSGRFSRMDSVESKNSSSKFLGNSFSSTSTAMSWVHKHRGYAAYGFARQSSIRRENSDSALDKIFARNRLLNWQMEGGSPSSPHSPPVASGDKSDVVDITEKPMETIDSNDDKIVLCDDDSISKDRKARNVSQIESSVSMASSGYCSNISTQCLSQHLTNSKNGNVNNNNDNNNKSQRTLSRHLSEPSHKVTVHCIAKHGRLLSEGIIPDEATFDEQQKKSVVRNVPIINIECV